jgi:DNA (cytosine-5)-methyltransferase 1
MRVLDFFCGAGGFSEGFRQGGFDVIWALDKWQTAVDTHFENHPACETVRMDIVELSLLPDLAFHSIVPDAEIIIGSPPCTFFSNSNRSGGGNKSQGKKLIEAFLRIVARKKFRRNSVLKYWILENVPKASKHIKRSYSVQSLGLKGRLRLTVKSETSGVYNAKYYGVPSNRLRYFCGEFPKPLQVFSTDDALIPLRNIIAALGSPMEHIHADIVDPLYGLTLPAEQVTDHHYVQELAEFEQVTIKRLKQDKGYMGKMAVPENLNKPARTIMATMSFSSRECFVLGHGETSLRAPTIREVATLMSFPIDYRFYGSSLGLKYKLVGNAVPPKMSFAFAKAIALKENLSIPRQYLPLTHLHRIDFRNLNFDDVAIKIERPKRIRTRFKYHIPEFKFDTFRVELTNHHSKFSAKKFRWDAEIHYSQSKNAKIFVVNPLEIPIDNIEKQKIVEFVMSLERKLKAFDDFQAIYCMTLDQQRGAQGIAPYELLNRVKNFVAGSFAENLDDFLPLSCSPYYLPKPIALGYLTLVECLSIMMRKGPVKKKNLGEKFSLTQIAKAG